MRWRRERIVMWFVPLRVLAGERAAVVCDAAAAVDTHVPGVLVRGSAAVADVE